MELVNLLIVWFKYWSINTPALAADSNLFNLIVYAIAATSFTKSAQLPYSSWLTDAMTAPTPVSALLHAATLVTAGIFLLLRSALLLAHSFSFDQLIFSIGALTALVAAVTAVFQPEIKKLVAISTTSQLGYIMQSALSSPAIFHLFTHAFFKGLIFLSSGAVIHSVDSELKVYKLSALNKLISAAFALLISGSLALAAIPFTAGFYSKELIVLYTAASYLWSDLFLLLACNTAHALTLLYSARLIYGLFLLECSAISSAYINQLDGSVITIIAPIFLSITTSTLGHLCSHRFCYSSHFPSDQL